MSSTNDDVRKPPDGDNHPGEYLQHGSRSRCLLPRDRAARRSLRRPFLHSREDDGHLLRPGLSGADAGVGEWTAHYIALRQLREPDAFPAADVGLLRALADLEGRRRVFT